jgi:hypothetical protein
MESAIAGTGAKEPRAEARFEHGDCVFASGKSSRRGHQLFFTD